MDPGDLCIRSGKNTCLSFSKQLFSQSLTTAISRILEGVQRTFTNQICSVKLLITVENIRLWVSTRNNVDGREKPSSTSGSFFVISSQTWTAALQLIKVEPRARTTLQAGQVINIALGQVVTQRMTTVSFRGPALFNSLPRWVRDEECPTTLKYRIGTGQVPK